ncbi:MAG: hypothetical protein KC591_15430, partial [Gemmatimonadetes bacterium]|nr:hypothetical protein [Gemmatimonadota bacterium]
FALFLGLGERPGRRLAGIAALLVAAYFAHVFVVAAILGAFATALVFTGLAPRVGLERDFSVRPAHWLATGLATVAFGAAVWFVFAHPGDGANSGRPLFDLSPLRLANLFEEPLSSPTLRRPLPALGLGFVVLAAWGIANRNAPARGVHLTTLAVAVAFAVLYWVGPTSLLEADGRIEEDIVPRFAPAVFLFGLAALRLPDRRGPRLLLLLATLAFAGVKLADVSFLHQRQHEVWREYRAAILEPLPEHAKILPILNEKGRNAPETTYFFQFLGNYVVPERGGYSPSLYAQRGQQFLRHLPPGGNGRGEHRDIYDRDVTETEWDFYDYLVVQTNREAPDIPGLAERTDFVTAAAGFRLYRIRHDEPRGAAAGAGTETGADLNPR